MNFFCGVDIGGTSVKLVLMDEAGAIRKTSSFSTGSESGPSVFLEMLTGAVQEFSAGLAADDQISAVGIGCTGPIDINSGVVLNPYTLPGLEGMHLTDEISSRLALPVYLENDANTAHLGEVALYDEGSVSDNTLLMTFGTGVGCSIRLGGKLFRIPGGIHPEIGHTPAGISADVLCYCGKDNCMENLLSGTAINRDADRLFGLTPEEILDQCDTAERILFRENLLAALTNSISTLVGIFNCDQVFISGGMKDFFAKYLIPETQSRLDKLQPIFGGTKIVLPKADSNSGSLGAALLAKIRYQEKNHAPNP